MLNWEVALNILPASELASEVDRARFETFHAVMTNW